MYKKTKKLLAWCLVVSMILTQMIFTNVAFAAASSSRLSGADRYETALRISQNGWTAGSTEYAVLAYGEDFPDALSAAPLAKKYNAPILLTAKDSLSAGVLDEINRVGAKTVFVVGGEGVVSKTVADALTAAGKTVERLAGASRYETALKVAEKVGTTDAVVVAYGENYPDALSIAPIAAAKGWPILLTDANSMDDAVKAYIGSKKAYVVGGSGVVSDAVYNGLSNAERVFGSDRYATNVAVMNKFAADLNFGKVFLATGEAFADALAGSVLAAKTASPMVLVGATMDPATESFVNGKVSEGTVVVALGGTSVVSDAAVAAVGGGPSAVLAISGVTALTQDGRGIRISFNKPVADLSSADITVVNKESKEAVGVESVSLSSNKMTADVWFLEESEGDYAKEGYVKAGSVYEITVVAGASTLAYTYERPNYVETRVVDVDAGDKEIDTDDGTFNVPDSVDFDYEYALGRTVRVWADKNDNVKDVVVVDDSSEETVKYDSIEIKGGDKEIKLIDEDKSYDIAEGATIVVNRNDDGDSIDKISLDDDDDDGVADDLEGIDGNKYDAAKVVFDDNGDIIFVAAYDWDDFMVVESVDGTEVSGYGDELDLEDFVVSKDGKTITPDDLEEGDILFFSESARDDDGYAEVYNKAITGQIEDITEGFFTVDDEEYDYAVDKYVHDVLYIDGDEVEDFDEDTASDMQDTEEDINVFVDRAGDAVFVTGDLGDAAKSTVVGMLYTEIKAYQDDRSEDIILPIDMINENGEKVKYDVEWDDIKDDTNIATTEPADNATFTGAGIGDLIKIKIDSDGDVSELYVAEDNTDFCMNTSTAEIEDGDKYAADSKLTDSTVVFNTEDFPIDGTGDEDDIEVVKWGDDKNFTKATLSNVYYDDENEAKYVVVSATDSDDDSTEYAVLLTKIEENSDDDGFYMKGYIDGSSKEVTIRTLDSNSVYDYFAKEKFDGTTASSTETADIVSNKIDAEITARGFSAVKMHFDDADYEDGVYTVVDRGNDDDDTAVLLTPYTFSNGEITTKTTAKTTDKITADGTDYRVSSDVAVYNVDSSKDIDDDKYQNIDAYTDLTKADEVYLIKENGVNFVRFVIIKK